MGLPMRRTVELGRRGLEAAARSARRAARTELRSAARARRHWPWRDPDCCRSARAEFVSAVRDARRRPQLRAHGRRFCAAGCRPLRSCYVGAGREGERRVGARAEKQHATAKADQRSQAGNWAFCCPEWAPSPPRSSPAACSRDAGSREPVGSLTQMGTIRLGKRTDNRTPLIKDFVPLAKLDDLVFGGWDLFHDNAYAGGAHADVLDARAPRSGQGRARAIKPMTAVFFPEYVKRLHGTNVKTADEQGRAGRGGARGHPPLQEGQRPATARVAVWCGSTEVHTRADRRAQHARQVRGGPARTATRASARR